MGSRDNGSKETGAEYDICEACQALSGHYSVCLPGVLNVAFIALLKLYHLHIRSIYKLHRVPKGKVLEWFAKKRAAEPHSARERRRNRNDKDFMNRNYKDPSA